MFNPFTWDGAEIESEFYSELATVAPRKTTKQLIADLASAQKPHARKDGSGARPWLAYAWGRSLKDKRGRQRRFGSQAAALKAART